MHILSESFYVSKFGVASIVLFVYRHRVELDYRSISDSNTECCCCGCCCCSVLLCVLLLLLLVLRTAAVRHRTPTTRGYSSYKQQ